MPAMTLLADVGVRLRTTVRILTPRLGAALTPPSPALPAREGASGSPPQRAPPRRRAASRALCGIPRRAHADTRDRTAGRAAPHRARRHSPAPGGTRAPAVGPRGDSVARSTAP